MQKNRLTLSVAATLFALLPQRELIFCVWVNVLSVRSFNHDPVTDAKETILKQIMENMNKMVFFSKLLEYYKTTYLTKHFDDYGKGIIFFKI